MSARRAKVIGIALAYVVGLAMVSMLLGRALTAELRAPKPPVTAIELWRARVEAETPAACTYVEMYPDLSIRVACGNTHFERHPPPEVTFE